MPSPTTPSTARAVRLMHAALTLGPVLAAVVFTIVRRASPLPALPQGSVISLALAVAAIGLIAVALAVLRPRIPEQTPEQSADAFWGDGGIRFRALTMWAVIEGATLCAAMGYLLTGATAPALALVLGIITLWTLRPARFERDNA
jgi:hypothetical protein